ncbi:MAG TPA: hypothetical protein VLA82_13040 [Actinomycetota bacterium]|nr:hypothetical protein [Actinomycetota bacterium]
MKAIVRAPRTWGTLVVALGVGLAVAFVGRSVAGDSCPTHEVFGATSCVDLVGSLAARMGVAAGVAVVFMEAVAAGLLRTAWLLEGQRDADGPG